MANKVIVDLRKVDLNYELGSSGFEVVLNTNVVKSEATNQPNIQTTTLYNTPDVFTPRPTIIQFLPLNNSTNVNDPVFVFRFDQDVLLTDSGIIKLDSKNPNGTYTSVASFASNSSRVTLQNYLGNPRDVVIDVSGLLLPNKEYRLVAGDFLISGESTVINNRLQRASIPTEVGGSASWYKFTTGSQILKKEFSATMQSAFILDVGNKLTEIESPRNFFSNQDNLIFESNPIQLNNVFNNLTYSVTLSTLNGEFNYANAAPSSTFTITGNPSQIDAILPQIKFYPNLNFNTDTTFNITISQGPEVLESVDVNLIHLGPGSINELIVFESTTTYTPDYKFIKYQALANLAVVGGGGGGAWSGGGGGFVSTQTGVTNLVSIGTTYSIIVGTGGAGGTGLLNSHATDGTESRAFNLSAPGGTGGNAFGTSGQPKGGDTNRYSGSLLTRHTAGSPGYEDNIYAIPSTVGYSSGDVLGGAIVAGSGGGALSAAAIYNISGPYTFAGTSTTFFTPLCGSFLSPQSVRGNTGQSATDTSGFDQAPAAGAGRFVSFLNQTMGVGGQGVTAYALPLIENPSTRIFQIWKGAESSTYGSGGAGSVAPTFGAFSKYYRRGNGTPGVGKNGVVAIQFYRN